MTHPRLALIVLALSALACMEQIVTPTPTAPPATPTASPVPTAEASATSTDVRDTAVIQATVYVRQLPDPNSAAIGSLTTGAEVAVVECSGDWCQIEPEGYVWRGCLSDNPDGLKCEARP